MTNRFELTDRVAVVTGGARGLGFAIGAGLREHGARVVLLDVSENVHSAAETLRSAEGPTTGSMQCDVSNRDEITECVGRIQTDFGRIDVLVNNAGIHRRVDALDFDPEDVAAQWAVNGFGMLAMAGAVGRVMVAQQSGSIINMSALGGGLVGLGRSGSAYGMTKGAVVSLTRDLAAEWGRHSIRVNAVAPGWIRTPMTEALQAHEQRSARVMTRVPMHRWGEPDDVVGAVLFLASDASRYVTGHTIPVDGGAANVIALDDD